MSLVQQDGFQMQIANGIWGVYMSVIDGEEVPVGERVLVYSDRSISRAQTVHDALNSGMLRSIAQAVLLARSRRAKR